MLDQKLQLKPGQTIAAPGHVEALDLEAPTAERATADAVLVFAANEAELLGHIPVLREAATAKKLTGIAYPKAKQLQTDINRDRVGAIAHQHGLQPVRQIAIDEIWSPSGSRPCRRSGGQTGTSSSRIRRTHETAAASPNIGA